ncbi:MAG TPA: dihydrolipoamide acetyltransferase family protein [Candidatus Limnocylindrales bacterium]|nr:dihydrolipoamide acetyltransferase family protein [Candidatus Limnocylindrales bacterium]
MPKPGQMTEECLLTLWRKAEGELVAKGDVLFEIETDKSTMEVESFHDGVLLRHVVPAGEFVPVNAVCAWIGDPGESIPDGASALDAAAPTQTEPEPTADTARAPATQRAAPAGAAAAAASPQEPSRDPDGPVPAISPRARRLASASGLDPRSVAGSGPGGRIVERDVQAALAAGAALARNGELAGPTEDEAAPRPLSRMRRVIAERLTLSATTIPTFSVTVTADVSRLLALRDELRAAGVHLTVTDVVLFATAQTLAEFPDVNSRTDGVQVWPRRRVHLGLAIALPAGLVVAVLRDADRLGVVEIHDQAAALVTAARAGTLGVDDLRGSTFTVSNLGMYGVDDFTAIVNPGESGILAVAAAVPTPVVIGDGIAVRTLMKLTLSADHRLVDGELGARFLNAVRRRLEDATAVRRELASS